MDEAKALFRNEKTTEFVIVTIPTIMAASESARLAKALRVEGVPVKTLVINQASCRRAVALPVAVRWPQCSLASGLDSQALNKG